MNRILFVFLILLFPVAALYSLPKSGSTDTVHVAPPTGERETDRASILAALEEVEPGGTVQFAAGKYVVGKVIQINIPQITFLGHHDGTILRGCEPDEFADIEKALSTASNPTEGWALVSGCGILELTGGNVTVRNFTFEYTRLGLLLGSSHAEDILYPSEGGYLIEENTFRNSSNSIRALLASPVPTIIRNNRFVNVFHAFSGAVSNFHILDNHISAPEPTKILPAGHPGFAIGLSALVSYYTVTSSCKQNLIVGNQIKGHPDGIILSARQPGAGCQNNVIRANTIEVQRAKLPASWPYFEHYPISDNDSTLVGIPLSLVKNDKPLRQENTFKNNLIEGNQIAGAEGLGIEILNASQNRIINNTITGVIRREPFPGNTLGGTQFGSAANGSGIWLSPGSDGNEIIGNTFEDIASSAVFMEGDSNRVEVRDLGDEVRDLGSGNQIHLEKDKVAIRSTDQCIEKTMIKHIEKLKIPGASLVIMKDGRIILEETYGRASLELDVDVTPSTLFPYASIAKIFTGTVILRLVQNGVFSLDDSITERMPNLPGEWSRVTVRHLLSNTSGLPDLNEGRRFENPFTAPKKSWDEILKNLTNRQVDFAPGEGFAYNNTNYALLGMLIEQTDGRKIEEYVQEEFAAIYNIESLRYGDARDAIAGRATWYTHFDFNSETPQLGPIRPLWIEYPPFLYTAAGLNGTARDLAKFIEAIVSGQILEDEYKREMWSASKLADGTTFHFDDSKTGTGLGWWVHDDPENPYVAMSGGSSGTIRYYIKNNLTVVMLTNLQGSQPEKIMNNLAENCLEPGGGKWSMSSFENKELENIGSRATLKDSIVTATRNLATAWIRLDPEEYLSYFSDDLIFYFQGSRVERDKFELIVRETMKSLSESTFEVLNPEVVVLGPDAASITFELKEVLVDTSEAVTELWGMLTLIYQRRGSEWLVVRAHESLRTGK